jgi:hypothetical protein
VTAALAFLVYIFQSCDESGLENKNSINGDQNCEANPLTDAKEKGADEYGLRGRVAFEKLR